LQVENHLCLVFAVVFLFFDVQQSGLVVVAVFSYVRSRKEYKDRIFFNLKCALYHMKVSKSGQCWRMLIVFRSKVVE